MSSVGAAVIILGNSKIYTKIIFHCRHLKNIDSDFKTMNLPLCIKYRNSKLVGYHAQSQI